MRSYSTLVIICLVAAVIAAPTKEPTHGPERIGNLITRDIGGVKREPVDADARGYGHQGSVVVGLS